MSEPKTEKSCSVRKEAFPEQDFIQNFSPRAAHRDFRRNSVFPQRALRTGAMVAARHILKQTRFISAPNFIGKGMAIILNHTL
ncbi:hypothetical protein [Alistipes ihumii]|jgi:hypothetical protein|uniref:hypothetical protein n=1 Tax=Alistipes ihumii TaxID=1470347 RepID=UPI003FEE5496